MGFRIANLTVLRRAYGGACVRRSFAGDLAALPSHIFSLRDHRGDHEVIAKRWHMGHSHEHGHGPGAAEGVFRLGLAADVALAICKSVAGYLSGSTAVVADAAHSISDIVLSGVAWLSYRAATAPKDEEHPYGHGKFETLGALGISGMLLVTSGGIAWHAVDVLQGILSSSSYMMNHDLATNGHDGHHHEVDLDHPILALSVTAISISVKEGLYWITKRAGDRQGSALMKANAWHHRSDAVSSVVALVGVGGTLIGIPLLDPLAGLLVSGMIWKAGFETGYHSVMELVDAGVDQSELDPIKQTISQVDGVKGCHRFRGRRAGSFLYLDLHIEVDPFLSVSAAHDIGEMVRHQIQDSHSQVAEVFIHIDPSHSCYSSESNLTNVPKAGGKPNIGSRQQEVETAVSNIMLTQFSEKMSLECITLHSLKGQILAQVHVTMPPMMKIGDATATAKEVEKKIRNAIPSINQVSIHLRLGSPSLDASINSNSTRIKSDGS